MRVRLEFAESLVAPELRCCLFAVPPQLESVADLTRALGADPAFSLASCAAARAGLRLHVRGFFLPPTQPIAGVLRDDDVVSVTTAAGSERATKCVIAQNAMESLKPPMARTWAEPERLDAVWPGEPLGICKAHPTNGAVCLEP